MALPLTITDDHCLPLIDSAQQVTYLRPAALPLARHAPLPRAACQVAGPESLVQTGREQVPVPYTRPQEGGQGVFEAAAHVRYVGLRYGTS